MRRTVFLLLIALLFGLLLTGCEAGYIARAAYEEGRILAGRRFIHAVLSDGSVSDDEARKLELVLAAREHARTMGLTPGRSFTSFTRVDRDVLAWVLAASPADSFALYRWHFPIVGSVPYKGFFDRADADAEAKRLQDAGYETSIRGTEAMSTLGWFDDPILSTTLRRSEEQIANTVIHESVHSTVWVPGHVDFNESLANFVGLQGAISFFGESPEFLERSERALALELEAARVIGELWHDLETLYGSALTREQKLEQRPAIFARHVGEFRKRYPAARLLKNVNNAEFIQLKLYLTGLDRFHALYESCDGDWPCFLETIREIADSASRKETKPFDMLEERIRYRSEARWAKHSRTGSPNG